MAEQQGQIYDPILKRGVTVEEAQQLIAERTKQQSGGGSLGVSNPMNENQSFGVSLPPVSEGDATDMLQAIPQFAGLIAQFTPAGRLGYKGAVGIPAAVELVRQKFSGEDTDISKAATQGAMGGVARVPGHALEALGRGGKSLVKRSLNLGSGPFAYNEVAEQVLPKLALSERASMTTAGVETARKRAAQTGSGSLQELSEVLAKGRFDAENAPALNGGGLMSMITHFLDNPKQLKIGQKLAEPFGVADTEKTIAPTVEALVRSLMAFVSSQQGNTDTKRRQP